MGRVCSEKKLRKGLWSPEEDERLASHIARFGVSCWSSIPDLTGLKRCGKSCRLRWMNYLRPDLKRGRFSQQEEDLIMVLHNTLGNSWSQIAARLPGRSDNDIKNFWNARLRKKLRQKETTAETRRRGEADRKPAAVFNPFLIIQLTKIRRALQSYNADRSSCTSTVGNAVPQAGDEPKGVVFLADADHRNAAAESVTPPSTSASTEATRDHGDDGFLAVMVDDEASLLLGEYYLDGFHDGFGFWGGQVFS